MRFAKFSWNYPVVLEEKIFKFVNDFLLFHLPLENGMALYLYKLESPSTHTFSLLTQSHSSHSLSPHTVTLLHPKTLSLLTHFHSSHCPTSNTVSIIKQSHAVSLLTQSHFSHSHTSHCLYPKTALLLTLFHSSHSTNVHIARSHYQSLSQE